VTPFLPETDGSLRYRVKAEMRKRGQDTHGTLVDVAIAYELTALARGYGIERGIFTVEIPKEPTIGEVIAWLKANTDAQDTGASNVACAIAIFEDAFRKMQKQATGASK
jgi:hypothetical protein